VELLLAYQQRRVQTEHELLLLRMPPCAFWSQDVRSPRQARTFFSPPLPDGNPANARLPEGDCVVAPDRFNAGSRETIRGRSMTALKTTAAGRGQLRLPALSAAPARTPTAAALKKKPRVRSPLQHLNDCRKLTDNTARLACFELRPRGMDQAEATGDIVVVAAKQPRKGAPPGLRPSPCLHASLFERGKKPEEIGTHRGDRLLPPTPRSASQVVDHACDD